MALNGSGPAQITAIFAARGAHITPSTAKFLNHLLGLERNRTVDELIDAMWGDQEDGGPLYADNIIRRYALISRRAITAANINADILGLAPIRWRVETGMGGYRLRYIYDLENIPRPARSAPPPGRPNPYQYVGDGRHAEFVV